MAESPHRLIIEAGHADRQYWRDLWRYRELFWFLSWRDVLVRYKQTVIGIAWSVIRPLLTMVVFTVVFGNWAKFQAVGAPYPVMVFAAMLPWQFFANALTESSGALIANSNLLTKVYFPRLIVPASAVIVSLLDLAIALVLLAGIMAWYGVVPSGRVIALPLFLGVAFLAAFGFGLWFAAMNVKYRDFRYVVPFVVQLGLYISPVGFSSSVVPDQYRLLYSLNPLVGIIDGFRWSLLPGETSLDWRAFGISATVTLLVFIYAVKHFRRTERSFADVI